MHPSDDRILRGLAALALLAGAFATGVEVGRPDRGSRPGPAALGPLGGADGGRLGVALPQAQAARGPLRADEPGVDRRPAGAFDPAGAGPRSHLASFEPASAQESSLVVGLLLELDRVEEAYHQVRAVPADSAHVYALLGRALRERGLREEARFALDEAMRRGNWGCDVVDDYVALDPEAFLQTLEREAGFWIREGYLGDDELAELRAQALHALGRSAEAGRLLGGPEQGFVESRGCVPDHLTGPDWKWRSWMETEPRKVEELLLRVMQSQLSANPKAVRLLGELYASEGRLGDLERELARWEEHHAGKSEHARVLVALADHRGWEAVHAFRERRPWCETAAWGLGDHLRAQGRMREAADVYGEMMAAHWQRDQEVEVLVETVRRAPRQLTPRLEWLVESVRVSDLDDEDRAEQVGGLGEVYWDLGERVRAEALWKEAHALNPDACWSWNLRLVALGENPR